MIAQNNISADMKNIFNCKNLLLVQDIDGVCIPLVKDPLERKIDTDYVKSVINLKEEFSVLTCGEHDGRRGVNRIIERAFQSDLYPKEKGLYLPGLAACGIEYQDNFGRIELLGVSQEEILFLKKAPERMVNLLKSELEKSFKNLSKETINYHAIQAVCDTRFSPAINLNSLFSLFANDTDKKRKMQEIMLKVMNIIIQSSSEYNLSSSFHLHISPNLGSIDGSEIIKFASKEDIGTTDIQIIIKGALKEAGLIVLLNKYLKIKTGISPFGDNFNVRIAPKGVQQLVQLCKEEIKEKDMPTLIGIGDTITSNYDISQNKWLRGGSDRGFLTLIQELGKEYKTENKIIFVDSSHGEVYRPSTKDNKMNGITDKNDALKFDFIIKNGPEEYKSWISKFANERIDKKNH